ncbi:hypothetical protein [Paenibacillus dauci]|uniref:hypothetical protein n=1 Tax=Paenibacillus dauci TaxID=1567106 RepID=UPI000619DB06|nr:hypothetical protein [Paenibacillus dauci]
MSDTFLNLTCSCGSNPEVYPQLDKGYDIFAFESAVSWVEAFTADEKNSENPHRWILRDHRPQIGEEVVIEVTFPFNYEPGDTFWGLFSPPYSFINGWEHSKQDEINQSAFIQSQFLSIIDRSERSARIRTQTQKVYLLPEIGTHLKEQDGSGYLKEMGMFRGLHLDRFDNWLYFTDGAQGDIGIWALLHIRENNYYLVAYGDWGFHRDYIYGGNLRVLSAEVDLLISQAKVTG